MRLVIVFMLCFQTIMIDGLPGLLPERAQVPGSILQPDENQKSIDPKEIVEAARIGNIQRVRDLLAWGVDVNTRDNDGFSALQQTAINGNKPIAELLIRNGANVNNKNNNGFSPLHEAAIHDNKEIALLLIEKRANINAENNDKNTPLISAAENGHDETLKLLIDRGANLHSANKLYGESALHKAAYKGHLSTVRLLIANGADINDRTSAAETAADIAKKFGHTDIVELLSKTKPLVQDVKENGNVAHVQLVSKKRPSEQACEKYMKLSEDNILKLGSVEAKEGEFPWMAALGYLDHIDGIYVVKFECGGTVISENFVMTAAHCVLPSNSPYVVRLGKVTLLDEKQTEDHRIREIIRHPDYSEITKRNDIALIRLLRSIFFNTLIAPACLQTNVRDESANVRIIVTGWGVTDARNRSSVSNVLRKTELMTMPLAECNTKLLQYNAGVNDEALKDGIGQGQYCTFNSKGSDSCYGDSGGPVQYFKNSRFATVVGVISFGVDGCGVGKPSVNTRVAYYIDWIESVVWPNGFSIG